MYYLRRGQLLNFVGLAEFDQPENESWTQKRPWADLKKTYEGWHPIIQTAIDAVDHDGCYRYALNNRPPVKNWSTARATLLGDAAHPTLPYLASGAAMAIEDGAILARCLETASSVSEAMQLYQASRIERTAKVVLESTANRTIYRIEDEQEMRKAFDAKDMNKTRSEWLYSYDPLSAPLGVTSGV
jgi:salicylate hydroxylase